MPGGLKLENAIHTSAVQAPDNEDLKLESLSHQLHMKAGQDVNINSYGANVKIGSLDDMKFTSKKGKVSQKSQYFAKIKERNHCGNLFSRSFILIAKSNSVKLINLNIN